MKKLITSLVIVGLVGSMGYLATSALFSDTEESVNNTFTTGTIDIAVDDQNPWERSEPYSLDDMKPSYTDYIEFVVHNVGTNPLNLTKTLANFDTYDVLLPESELSDDPNGTIHDIDNWINYDMRVELYQEDPTGSQVDPVWWETIYMDEDDVKIGTLEGEGMYLGMVPVGWYMRVIQSYHMVTETGNAYQGDGMSFDIVLTAEQLTNTIVLEDKYESNTDVSHHVWNTGGVSNGKDAVLTYKVKDSEFAFTLDVQGMADGLYTLVTWEDPTYTWTWGSFAGTTVLANVNVSGGVAHLDESVDLNQDITNAKVWLVPGNLGAPATTGVSLPWNPTNTLFETGLMDYYDSL